MKIAIVNQHTNNFGDDAAGTALVDTLHATFPGCHVDVFYMRHLDGVGLPTRSGNVSHHFLSRLQGRTKLTSNKLAIALHLAFGVIVPREFRRMLTTCREADAVFVSPAGANLGRYRDWLYLYVVRLLTTGGVRLIFCQNTVGPSGSRVFDYFALRVFRKSDMFVREAASHQWLASHHIGSYLGVDTAILLPRPDLVVRQPQLGVIPTSLDWHESHQDSSRESIVGSLLPNVVAQFATQHGLEVRIIPHLYGGMAESSLLEDIRRLLDERGIKATIASNTTLADYRREIAESKLILTMRYHGLVLAAHSEVPVVSLSYENKMLEAAAYWGIRDICVPLDDATEEIVQGALELALTNADAITAVVRERKALLHRIASAPVNSLASQWLRDGKSSHAFPPDSELLVASTP